MQICFKTLEFQQLFQEWNEKKQEMINNNCFIARLDHAAIPREIFGTWKSMFTQVKVFEKLLKCILPQMKPCHENLSNFFHPILRLANEVIGRTWFAESLGGNTKKWIVWDGSWFLNLTISRSNDFEDGELLLKRSVSAC